MQDLKHTFSLIFLTCIFPYNFHKVLRLFSRCCITFCDITVNRAIFRCLCMLITKLFKTSQMIRYARRTNTNIHNYSSIQYCFSWKKTRNISIIFFEGSHIHYWYINALEIKQILILAKVCIG